MAQQSIGKILLMPKGEYNSSTNYMMLDWVRYDGKAWVCKVNNTQGITPDEGTNWTVLAQDGNVSGSVAWSGVTGKPFSTIDTTTDFSVDGSDKLKIKRDTFGTMRIVSGGTTTDLEASGDSIIEIDAGTNVTIAADDSSNPKKITINSTGGSGSSTFAGLDDTSISNPQADQIVQYKSVGGSLKLQNVAMPQGGHTMLPTPSASVDEAAVVSAVNTARQEGGVNDDVPSLYGMSLWSNCDSIQLLTPVAIDSDGLGEWEDEGTWETSGHRSGWLIDASLYGVLSNDDYEILPVFKIPEGTNDAVGLLSMRIDDGITGSTGGVAFKFTAPIQTSGVYVGVKIKHLRTNTKIITTTP